MNGLKVGGNGLHLAPALPNSVEVDAVYTGDDVDFDGTPGVAGATQWKEPVRCATTGAITIATGLNAGDTIDAVTLAAGDRVLVKDQGTASENGIYIVDVSPYRAGDMDDDTEVLGAVVYVVAGTANAGTTWAVTNTAATVVDADAIDWAEVGGGLALDDLTDVTISAAAAGDRLRFDGAAWANSSLIWRPAMTFDGTNWLVAVTGSGDAIMTEA